MSEEPAKEYNLTVVFGGLSKEEVDKLSEHLLANYELDAAKMNRRLGEILLFMDTFNRYLLTACEACDFDEQNTDFATHPQNVIRDIKARAKEAKKIIPSVVRGQRAILVDEKEIRALMDYVLSYTKEGKE